MFVTKCPSYDMCGNRYNFLFFCRYSCNLLTINNAFIVSFPGMKPNCISFISTIDHKSFFPGLFQQFSNHAQAVGHCSFTRTTVQNISFYRLVPPHLFFNHLAYLFHITLLDKVSISPPLQLDNFQLPFQHLVSEGPVAFTVFISLTIFA